MNCLDSGVAVCLWACLILPYYLQYCLAVTSTSSQTQFNEAMRYIDVHRSQWWLQNQTQRNWERSDWKDVDSKHYVSFHDSWHLLIGLYVVLIKTVNGGYVHHGLGAKLAVGPEVVREEVVQWE